MAHTPPPFTGWLKTDANGWRRVCAAATWEACWALLLAVPADDAPSVERLVRRGDRHPDRRRKPR
jgi:hypothetical protein